MISKKTGYFSIIIMLMAAFSAYGDNNWDPNVGEGVEEAYWLGDVDYWSQGRFPEGSDNVNIRSTVTCILDGEVQGSDRFRFHGDDGSTVIIADGGRYVQTGDGGWNGMDNSQGTLIIEDGGYFSVESHFWIGADAGSDGSVLIMNGGEMRIADRQAVDLGRDSSGTAAGYAYLNEGTLSTWRFAESSSSGWFNRDSYMDIGFGKFVLRQETDHIDRIERLIDSGGIRAFGGRGTVEYRVDPQTGWTIVTGVSPMEPSPAYNGVAKAGTVDLQWTNLEAANPGDPVFVDVWFGDDPANLMQVVAGGENTTGVQVEAPLVTEPTTYYWRVDTDIDGDWVEGPLFRFDVTSNVPPLISITTPRMITWAGEPIQLETELVDDYPEEVTYSWQATTPDGDPLDEPAVFEPGADVANPTVTVNYHASIFVVTVTVDDGFNEPVSASLRLDCAADPCGAARAIGMSDDYPGDFAGDCKYDLEDFATIASEWLADYKLTEPFFIQDDE